MKTAILALITPIILVPSVGKCEIKWLSDGLVLVSNFYPLPGECSDRDASYVVFHSKTRPTDPLPISEVYSKGYDGIMNVKNDGKTCLISGHLPQREHPPGYYWIAVAKPYNVYPGHIGQYIPEPPPTLKQKYFQLNMVVGEKKFIEIAFDYKPGSTYMAFFSGEYNGPFRFSSPTGGHSVSEKIYIPIESVYPGYGVGSLTIKLSPQ